MYSKLGMKSKAKVKAVHKKKRGDKIMDFLTLIGPPRRFTPNSGFAFLASSSCILSLFSHVLH
jgi:hypothetical protein